jgi:phosphoserine phosphatase
MPPDADPLPSWNDTPARRAILAFVDEAGREGSPGFVEPRERVAVFDNDGTLWCEKPMPIQLDFILRRLVEMAEADASLRGRQPWKAAYEKDFAWLGQAMDRHYEGDDADLKLLAGAVQRAFGGMAVEAYEAEVEEFLRAARHPTLGRPYRDCTFLPMVELVRHLERRGFTVYIASGGDRDFMRPASMQLYGIPRERVVGSTFGLQYRDDGPGGAVMYKPEIEFFDDGPEKPVRIWSRVGRRPVVAVGNSNGDRQMLRFAGGGGPALRLLIRHDDGEREFAYRAGAEQALDDAAAQGWTVVSMRGDWRTVFGPAAGSPHATADVAR